MISFFLLGETAPSSPLSFCSFGPWSSFCSSSCSKLGSSSVSCSSTEGLRRRRCSLMLRWDRPSWFSHMDDTGRENSVVNRNCNLHEPRETSWQPGPDRILALMLSQHNINIPHAPWLSPPSRLLDSRYLLLVERSKSGAGRSMRALACLVWACVLPLYRNFEPITKKPLGGGSGHTSLLMWKQFVIPTLPSFTTKVTRELLTIAQNKPFAWFDLGALVGRTKRVLPEKGVMLNADFPQPLGSSVVRKLKTNCAFKLLVLEGREEIEMYRKH